VAAAAAQGLPGLPGPSQRTVAVLAEEPLDRLATREALLPETATVDTSRLDRRVALHSNRPAFGLLVERSRGLR